MTKAPAMTKQDFINDAKSKGFKVLKRPDGGWVIHVPQRKNHKANVQGDFVSEDRAWMAAASIAQDFKAER